MQPIQVLVCDLDHTLLREDSSLSDYTADVLARCRERDIRFVIATARPMRTLREFVRIPYDAAVYLGGAAVESGEVEIVRHTIAYETVENLLALFQTECPDALISLEMEDATYVDFSPEKADSFSGFVTRPFGERPRRAADKIIFSDATERGLRAIEAALPEALYLHTDAFGLSFIMHRRATKLCGLTELLAQWGIPLSRCAAFGDDLADVEMLEASGIGVAVQNATEAAKKAADEICASNEQDGVAHWLEEKLLQ